jgi:hypothetical protein
VSLSLDWLTLLGPVTDHDSTDGSLLSAQQASLRNLLLDVTPAEQLSSANAWQGRVRGSGAVTSRRFA